MTGLSGQHKYWRAYREALSGLGGKDLEERCSAAGYCYECTGIRIPFLGAEFMFSIPRLELSASGAGSAAEDALLAERILILHYMAKASGAPATAELSSRTMVGFDQLPGGRFYGSAFRNRAELPLARRFAADPPRLLAVARRFDGVAGDFGTASVTIRPFPHVPVTIIIWQGDEEFPSNGKMLFDASAEDHLSTEDLAVLGEVIVRRFKEEGNV